MEYFPELLPSFAGLPEQARHSVLFTQGKMNFNHGWFVQAEAPPGGMLRTLKSVLASGGATSQDLGLYFLHWFTDLSGAEATPLGGAEKFVLKFPHSVLTSFLWSIPFLGKLETMTETAVVEQYLKARWRVLSPETPCPQDASAIAALRIAVMAQSDEGSVEAYKSLPLSDRQCLALELARTGCAGQRYSTTPSVGAGPAFLIYYGPALLQKNAESPRCFRIALRVMAEVLRKARALWPLSKEGENRVVTILVAELKTQTIDITLGISRGDGRWYLVRHNDCEGAVEFRKEPPSTAQQAPGSPAYEVLHFTHCLSNVHEHESSQYRRAGIEDLLDNGFGVRLWEEDIVGDATSSCSDLLEPPVEKKTSRRNSQLPFTTGEQDFMESTVESGLAANLRQENWILKDQIATLSDEVARLRARLAVYGAVEGTASGPPE